MGAERLDPLLSIAEVQHALADCHRATVYRYVQEGRLPPPVKIGRRSGWRESAVARLIDGLERDVGQNVGQNAAA